MQTIKVSVVEFSDRRHYQMQYRDPATQRKTTRSTGIERTDRKRERTEAERVAAKWEAELREGRYKPKSHISWPEFRERYESEVLTGLAEKTAKKSDVVQNSIERILNPQRLSDLTPARLSHYQSKLREGGCTESTIDGYLAHLQAALKWAVVVGMLPAVPEIKRPKRARKSNAMKGRAVTGEEFDRLLDKVPSIVGDKAAPSWRHYVEGLWWSGLRLGESLELFWDRDDRLCVDLSGKRPMLWIPAELEKGNQDRLLPMAPEFAQFLQRTPKAERSGRVFKLMRRCHSGERLSDDVVIRTVGRFGRKAGIKVWTHPVSGKVKYASAHDLRRSFGFRWASRVMPAVLQQLMRHESIDTTMRFYVGRNAEATADAVWEAFGQASGNTFGNTDPETVDISRE